LPSKSAMTEASLEPSTSPSKVADSRETKRMRTAKEEEEKKDHHTSPPLLEMSEEEASLRQAALEAIVLEFDPKTGLPVPHSSFFPHSVLDPVHGIVKRSLPPELFQKLKRIHEHIKTRMEDGNRMVPWSGLNEGDTKLRAFGFMGPGALKRMDESSVRLYAAEKMGDEAKEDEEANRKAICILDLTEEDEEKNSSSTGDEKATTKTPPLNILQTTQEFVETINPKTAGLDPKTVCSDELIAYQINLHNGVRYLPAHLDFPLHEGFGKVISTVAVRGSATILLISIDTVRTKNGDEIQPAWRFHLNEGECYVLSDRARNTCLHAVLADDDNRTRESLNLRFGLHTEKEAEEQTTWRRYLVG